MPKQSNKRPVLGVLGGMGPFASAEFLRSIYENTSAEREQDLPVVLLYSDPTFADRTEAFLAGDDVTVLDHLNEALHQMLDLGVSRIVICCVTIHHLLPRLHPDVRERIVSLLDVIFAEIIRKRRKHLLICTNGARSSRIFQNHSHWERAKEFIVLPSEDDQGLIHRDLIYQIKKNRDVRELIPLFEWLLSKYELDSFIAGCTEMHLLIKHLISSKDMLPSYGFIDPLTVIASEFATSTGEMAHLMPEM